MLVSLPHHPQAGPDPRWKIPPSVKGTVLQRVEQGEPLRQVAHDYGVSYEAVRRVQRAGLKFAPGDLMVVERLPGDANTAWGVPSVLAPAETRPIDVVTAQRNVALLRAAWDMLEEVVMASSAELRKGPRGGGRDRDGIWHHVIEAERAYARKAGVRRPPFEVNDKSALKAMRQGIAAVLSKSREDAGGRMQRERVALSENCEEV